ncbi:hypothetical protein SAMD00019534_027990 [Acytostelium subglobosum LB1]|uniref:hypothetical protein n=1 Tax=Acytostelium subglobosum LB1 TaxID=1410327 RepID=UPI000644F509|nr:hypothetical protein SAMD00019534_027990 [Acytostelium subglobosum LB1]GAM19624.1 hypothetical protein SAMD00019534_027990 [Acytostelium subglobosum LB1]|eukprot:XP_012756386.1 hypothetical protein SAMD00019534_027990 [Acytostelium subglobosum LB1]
MAVSKNIKKGARWVSSYFPRYELLSSHAQLVGCTQRMPMPQMILLSLQHVMAMFGSTVVGPMLMGFSPNTGLFFSGIGTLIFYVCTGGRMPSYLGSSFAFIGVVNAATGYHYVPGAGLNPNIDKAAGGILICGIIYLAISIIVIVVGYRWLEILMPPIVTGAVVMSIGLNLAGAAIGQANTTGFDAWMAFATVMAIILITMYAPGPLKRLPILLGGIFGYLIYLFFGLGGIGPGISYDTVRNAKWIGFPPTTKPIFDGSAISLIAPVAIILAAENIGHVKAVGSMTGTNMDKLLGRAFLGDSLATILAASFGSTGTTTYAENIGVMSITKIFSTLTFVMAAVVAVALGLLPVFGAVIQTIPPGVFGGISIVLFGLIAVTGAKIWITNQVDFSQKRNLFPAGIALVLGCGMVNGLVISWGVIKIDGIGASTLSAIILYQLMREDWPQVFRRVYNKVRGHKGGGSRSHSTEDNGATSSDHVAMTILEHRPLSQSGASTPLSSSDSSSCNNNDTNNNNIDPASVPMNQPQSDISHVERHSSSRLSTHQEDE